MEKLPNIEKASEFARKFIEDVYRQNEYLSFREIVTITPKGAVLVGVMVDYYSCYERYERLEYRKCLIGDTLYEVSQKIISY